MLIVVREGLEVLHVDAYALVAVDTDDGEAEEVGDVLRVRRRRVGAHGGAILRIARVLIGVVVLHDAMTESRTNFKKRQESETVM